MRSKALILVAALASGAVVFAVPTDWRAPVLVALAVLAFGLYAVRERAALRALRDVGQRQSDRVNRDAGQLRIALAEQGEKLDAQAVQAARIEKAVAQTTALGKEIASLHVAATNETLAALRGHEEENRKRLNGFEEILGRSEKQLAGLLSSAEARRLNSGVLQGLEREFRQVEALLNLYATVTVREPLPPSRKWAMSPDLLAYLVSLVQVRKPSLIVELGSGLSSVWLGYALEKSGHAGRLISIEHDAEFLAKTRRMLADHGLDHLVELRHAPLSELTLDGESWPWYDRAAFASLSGIDLLIVDGPPAATRDHARYPALPVLSEQLASDAVVIMDDCVRQEETDIVSRWRDAYPGWNLEVLPHEKITSVLIR
ncbi:putative O-methyltransferase YrrM [Hamadaea flava]|uniref:Class I SAM-dependent methyltransferase n=1 Tax=Hamadaea flava TaxID=1742688 RepID=A0ABV8LWL3_9ACTN|nr:class I SAM-dependent methyltransferase [Hamadaea flava]MCP2327381.1 putative O-methyltransferase YrrM [Hamadaea flava]